MKKSLGHLLSLYLLMPAIIAGGCAAVPAAAPAVSSGAAEEVPAQQAQEAGQEVTAQETGAAPETAAAEETAQEETAPEETAEQEAAQEEAAEQEEAVVISEEAEEITISEEISEGGMARPGEMRGLAPAELIAEMTAGWNLGNSLDATSAPGLAAETSWGNPKTTKEMIDAVCEKGFNTIRIPVTWDSHVGSAPEYEVDSEWMDRVQEVVNYAIDDGMFVILDTHHEENWRILDDAHIDAVNAEHTALWRQIAERFKNYGDHLIFDGLNEPRVKGGANEWNGGTSEGRACLNLLNQSFVDTVRGTGGNNDKRLLLVTSFASSAVIQTIGSLKIPEDDHLAVSIHAYTPYGFTYKVDADWALSEWDGSHNYEIDKVMNDLKRIFIDKGIPVIITEYGAQNKDGNDKDVAAWAKYYVEKAKSLGIVCVWWDNGCYTTGNEQFGIFNRSDCTWYSEEVADAVTAAFR